MEINFNNRIERKKAEAANYTYDAVTMNKFLNCIVPLGFSVCRSLYVWCQSFSYMAMVTYMPCIHHTHYAGAAREKRGAKEC